MVFMDNTDNTTLPSSTTPSLSAFDKGVSLRSLKKAEPGDMIVLTKQNGYVGLYSVKSRVPTRGRYGNVAITLVNHVTGKEWSFKVSTELPDNRITLIRRVSKGVNASRSIDAVEAPMGVNIPEEFGPASEGGVEAAAG